MDKQCDVGFIWSKIFQKYDFGSRKKDHERRFDAVVSELDRSGLLNAPRVKIIPPEPLSVDLLKQAHSDKYLQEVKRISETGIGDIDVDDTPGFKGIFQFGLAICGALITGTRAIHSGEIQHSFCPTGGFHHASYDRGGGFSIFNDIAPTVYDLKDLGYKRILIADFDVHHGNGTQTYFYDDPGVMHISFHEAPEWLYPHDGHIQDIGSGLGRGYNINMHFPMDSGDAVYRYAFDKLVPPLVEFYKPDFIILLPGFDTHYLDPLAQLNLTTAMAKYVTEFFHDAAHRLTDGRLAVAAGGGYHP
ncbi:MAG: hypothetical protein RTU30_10040, partial [Candidatus Thorarchaeota archaeon]